jgi:uncharacterized protein
VQLFLKTRQKVRVLGHSPCGHRPLFLLGLLLTFCLAGSPSAQAFDCAKAYLPVDFVICSDPAVLNANEAHEKAWYDTRARLTDAEKQELLADQRQWLKEFPPRCGVSARGERLAVISKDRQLCITKALGERTAFLDQYNSPAAEAQSPTSPDIKNWEPALQKAQATTRMRQATFTAAAGNIEIQGWCERKGTSVTCRLVLVNNGPTGDFCLYRASIYDRESRVYHSNSGVLTSEGPCAKLLHGLPARGAYQFEKVPPDVSEIYRMELFEGKVVIESPVPIG